MPYVNLPGSYVELQDGNLGQISANTSQSVLVIGTASKGLTSEPYQVTDIASVVREFGATSELTRGASEVKKGGGTNIYLYRLPGTAPSVSAIGADAFGAPAGIKITPIQQSPEAASNYAVAYKHAELYSSDGAGEVADKSRVVAQLVVVNLTTDAIVWMGNAFDGATSDNGEVDVSFDMSDVDLGIGSAADSDALETLKLGVSVGGSYTGGEYSVTVSGVTVTGDLSSTEYTEVSATSGTEINQPAGTAWYFRDMPKFTVTLPTGSATGAYTAAQVNVVDGGSAASDEVIIYDELLAGTDTFSESFVDRVDEEVDGTGLEIAVTINYATSGAYTVSQVSVADAGANYKVGDVLVWKGTELGGTSANNLALTVTGVNVGDGGTVTDFIVSGTRFVHKPFKAGVTPSTLTIPGTALGGTAPDHNLVLTVTSVNALGLISTVSVTGTRAAQPLTASNVADLIQESFQDSPLDNIFDITRVGPEITFTPNGLTHDTSGVLVYPSEHPWAGFAARPFVSAPITMTGAGITISGESVSHRVSRDIGLYPLSLDRAFSSVQGGVYIPLSKVKDGGGVSSYGLRGSAFYQMGSSAYLAANGLGSSQVVYDLGDTGQSLSLIKRYEKIHTAFEDLDLAAFDFIVPLSVHLNSPNIADGLETTWTDSSYPVPGSSKDALGYLATVNNGDYTYTYYWSDDSIAPKIASAGVPGDASPALLYTEVNFAHLLAKYCHENSSDYKFVHGVIGTTLPSGLNPRAIRAYYGSAPSYVFDGEENAYYVTENGAGLLGHKFVGGHTTFNNGLKHGGLFLTKDGLIDYAEANLVLDENQRKVDLGKYVSVVAFFGRTTDDLNPRRPNYILNAATMVAGLLPTISVANSLINEKLSQLTIDYRTETKVIDAGCGLGLVMAKSEPNGVSASIADSPTFASPTSDYTRLTTVRIISRLVDQLRVATRPFIGKGLSAPMRAALESAIGEVLKDNIAGEPIQTVTSASFKIEQSASDRVLGKMKVKLTITPVFELRQITFSVNLSAQ
jgi:hypothetical protein